MGAGNDRVFSLAVQADGKILVSGASNNGSNDDFALVRYNTDGSLDTSFDTDGILTTAVGASSEYGASVTIQADGKILVAGASNNGSDNDVALVRYNTDGSLDTSFSSDGIVTTAVGPGTDWGVSVTLQVNGKIVVAGYSHNGSNNDFALLRYNTDGSLDTSFDSDGILTTDVSGANDLGYSVAVLADGRIVVAGASNNGSNDDFALVRYNTDGSLDTTFDPVNTLSGTPVYVEGGAAVVLDANVQIYDAERSGADDFSGVTLTLARNGGAEAEDQLAFDGITVTTSGANVLVSGTQVGTYTFTGGQMAVTFGANATQARVNTLMQNIVYWNSSDAPPATVQLDWTFDDGNTGSQGSGGALQATGSTTVTIQNAADLAITAPASATTNEDTAFVYSGANVIQVDDGIAADTRLQVSLSVANGTLTLASTTGITFVEGTNGSAGMVIDGLESDINTALDGLQFDPFAEFSGADTLNITMAIAADLKGYYTFEGGNADDHAAGSADDGTFVGNAGTTIDGTRGEVLTLDGTTDSVSVLGMYGSPNDVTLAGCVNLTASSSQGAEVISLGDNVFLRLDRSASGRGLEGGYWDGTTWNVTSSGIYLAGDGWNHVAYTFDSVANTQRVYLNGVVVAETNYSQSVVYAKGTDTWIGTNGNGVAGFDFNGMIDDARIYARALSADEISALASEPQPEFHGPDLTQTFSQPGGDGGAANFLFIHDDFAPITSTSTITALYLAPDADSTPINFDLLVLRPAGGDFTVVHRVSLTDSDVVSTDADGVRKLYVGLLDVQAGDVLAHWSAVAGGSIPFSLTTGGSTGWSSYTSSAL
ncbi:MAG: hypothetical protein KDA96_23320, partial [Planctomycetaceae bacterium]|nr:hypothetical protein [Planctomycetaceae bacterium]